MVIRNDSFSRFLSGINLYNKSFFKSFLTHFFGAKSSLTIGIPKLHKVHIQHPRDAMSELQLCRSRIVKGNQ
jgi:hypothetical protein